MPTKEYTKKRTKRLGELDIPVYTGGLLQTGPLGFNTGRWITQSPSPMADRYAPFNLNQRFGGYGPYGGGAAEVWDPSIMRRGQPLFPYENPRKLQADRMVKYRW